MKEIRNILSEYEKNKEEQEMALATVVKVRGSSYRSPGARMLIRKDGRWTGSISGGCLEGDALRKARQIMVSKQPELVTYDTMDDDNDIGVGLGCNGIIDVLIEPISKKNNPTDRLKALLGMENVTVVATIFRSSLPEIAVGIQCQINQKGKPEGLSEDNDLNKAIYNDLEEVLVSRKATVKSYAEDKVEVFFELIEPSIDLQIFGGGFDARPVVELAKTLGWHVSVADECIAHIAPANFPSADEVKLCTRDFIPEIVQVKPYTAAVLMSHNYPYDYAV
ncbi:MAG: XdhC family protein, partial [Fulvivirga sp.]|nr:XdhC family protein [Fulvivirga sp.]